MPQTMSNRDGRLIVVSNAEPYKHIYKNDEIQQEKVAGGLTTGLDPIMMDSDNLWIAWGRGEADFEVTDQEGKVSVPTESDGYTLQRVQLSEQEANGFYYGFSNKTLWPLCHSLSHRTSLNADDWETYKQVNKKYAENVLEEYRPADKIWVHDYQLALVPQLIRERFSDAMVGLFWHIPWPSWEMFGIIPWRKEIISGMLGADFIGFHTNWLVHNFFDSVAKLGGAVNRHEKLAQIDDEQAAVQAIPLGIDVDFFNPTEDQQQEAEKLRENFQTETQILSVDRLDYTKGIDRRMEAIRTFFKKYPKYLGEVTFIQRISPSRSRVQEYQNMRENIEQWVGQVNGEFQREEWVPVRYFYQHLPQEALIPYYLAADIGLITPLIDGMNLVAKEYVASRESGSLILSEFAGAAETLTEAIQVNPYDKEEVADALDQAINSTDAEREQEFATMNQKLERMDIHWWRDRFLDEWELSLHSQ